MIRLHINIDHVATLRNQRDAIYPSPVLAAELCELAGADGITAHLREDRRHIRDADIDALRASVTTLLNLEMAATEEMCKVAERVRPEVVTLVPERREERTTEGGLDVVKGREHLAPLIQRCLRAGIKVSLFIEADEAQIRASHALGVQQIELHTGHYAEAKRSERPALLERLGKGAKMGHELGLEVAAGHGLTRANVIDVAALPHIEELNIGHSVVAEAVFVGLSQAVRDLRVAIDRGVSLRG